jgi:UDP-3-O-[3-hydroxymyristoyl] glucosamine N-acyltransferase
MPMATSLNRPVSTDWLCGRLGLALSGPARPISRVCSLGELGEDGLSFALPPRGLDGLATGTVFGLPALGGGPVSVIASPHPRLDFIRAQHLLRAEPGFAVSQEPPEIHPTALIGPGAVIESGASVGEGTIIGPNAVIRTGARLGRFCEVHANAVIGDSGFGFERDEQGRPWRMIHLGGVRIGDHVEIGALATIARGALGDTVIGDHVKIDDHAHIAHNCKVGESTIITACAELSGSIEVGKRCWIAPNAAVRQKLKLGDGAFIGIGAVVIRSVEPGGKVFGNPGTRLPERPA